MQLHITGYSTAMFATWYFVEDWGLLLDAGDGIVSTLLHKARKIEYVFISHADRDHLTGLLQFNQLNAREGFPKLYYPSNCGSFIALEQFSKNFDAHVQATSWTGIEANQHIAIKQDILVQSIRNNHVIAPPDVHKSLGYQIYQVKTKLKAQYAQMPQANMQQLMQQLGKQEITEQIRTNLLTYTGDTPVDAYEKWNNTKILIHEATFLGSHTQGHISPHGNKHSYLDDVIKMVAELNIETLILGHFSSRYSAEEIDAAIKAACKQYNIKIPVFRVLPGQIHRNILAEAPIN